MRLRICKDVIRKIRIWRNRVKFVVRAVTGFFVKLCTRKGGAKFIPVVTLHILASIAHDDRISDQRTAWFYRSCRCSTFGMTMDMREKPDCQGLVVKDIAG